MKTLIKNARIVDGSGNKSYMGSVLIEDERIVAVGDVGDVGADSPANAYPSGVSVHRWQCLRVCALLYSMASIHFARWH